MERDVQPPQSAIDLAISRPITRRAALGLIGAAAAACTNQATITPEPTLSPTPTPEPTPTPNPILDSPYYVPPAERETGVQYAGMILRKNPKKVSIAIHDLYIEGPVFSMIQTLRIYGVNATWFAVGEALRFHSDTARALIEAVANGDEIANHTENHIALDNIPLSRVEKQSRRQESTVQELMGINVVPLLSPPGGNGAYGNKPDPEMGQEAIEDGWILTTWSKASNGYLNRDDTSNKARKQVLRDIGQVEEGDIIILHDAWPDANALPQLIENIQKAGLEIDTITRANELDPNLFNRPSYFPLRPLPSPSGFEPSPSGSGLYIPESPRPSASGIIFEG